MRSKATLYGTVPPRAPALRTCCGGGAPSLEAARPKGPERPSVLSRPPAAGGVEPALALAAALALGLAWSSDERARSDAWPCPGPLPAGASEPPLLLPLPPPELAGPSLSLALCRGGVQAGNEMALLRAPLAEEPVHLVLAPTDATLPRGGWRGGSTKPRASALAFGASLAGGSFAFALCLILSLVIKVCQHLA